MKSFKWLIPLIICIGSFMIHTNNVKASNNNKISSLGNITNSVTSGTITYQNSTASFNNVSYLPSDTSSYLTISFNNITIPQYANYFTLAFNVYDLDPEVVYSCNNEYISGNILEDINFSTTYADGSQAQSSGTIESSSNTYRYCNSFKSSNDNSFSIFATYYLSDNTKGYCNIIGSGQDAYILCPIDTSNSNGNKYLNRIYFAYTTNSSNLNRVNYRYSNNINFVLDDTYIIRDKLDTIISKLDTQNSNTNAIKNNTETIKNDIKDSSIDNNSASSNTSSWSNKNASNGTITNLLTLPISLLQNILNGIQTSCSNFSLGTLFDTELVLPCINLSDLIGSTLFNVIDLLFSGFMILNIAKKLIKIFNDFTNLKSNQIDEIYSNGGGSN